MIPTPHLNVASPCVPVSKFTLFIRMLALLGKGSPQWPYFTYHLCKALSQIRSHFEELGGGVELKHVFWECDAIKWIMGGYDITHFQKPMKLYNTEWDISTQF